MNIHILKRCNQFFVSIESIITMQSPNANSISNRMERNHNNRIFLLLGSPSPSQTIVQEPNQREPTLVIRSGNNTPQHCPQSTMGPPPVPRALLSRRNGGSGNDSLASISQLQQSPYPYNGGCTPMHQFFTIGPPEGFFLNRDTQSSPGSIQSSSSTTC